MKSIPIILFAAVLIGCQGTETTTTPAPADTAADTAADTPAESSTDSQTDSTTETQEDPESAASENQSDETIVIDVRSKEEWETGHVEQAHHIPHTELADRIGEVTEDKDAKIVLYCAAGGRAGKAKTSLEELGFTNVENGGGYDDVKDRFANEETKP